MPMSLLLILGAQSVFATTLDQLSSFREDGSIRVAIPCGSLRVEGWQKATARLTGEVEGAESQLSFVVDGSTLRLETRHGDDEDSVCADLLLQVPASARLQVELQSASLVVEGMAGRLDLQSSSGDIVLDAAPSQARVETISGDIELKGAAEDLEIGSVSGNLELNGGPLKRVEAETVSGDIEISGGPLYNLEAESVSGDIDMKATLAAAASLELDSHSGDVNLSLPPSISAAFKLRSFSGDLKVAEQRISRSGFGPGTSMDFVRGDGNAQVDVETFSGDVKVDWTD